MQENVVKGGRGKNHHVGTQPVEKPPQPKWWFSAGFGKQSVIRPFAKAGGKTTTSKTTIWRGGFSPGFGDQYFDSVVVFPPATL